MPVLVLKLTVEALTADIEFVVEAEHLEAELSEVKRKPWYLLELPVDQFLVDPR